MFPPSPSSIVCISTGPEQPSTAGRTRSAGFRRPNSATFSVPARYAGRYIRPSRRCLPHAPDSLSAPLLAHQEVTAQHPRHLIFRFFLPTSDTTTGLWNLHRCRWQLAVPCRQRFQHAAPRRHLCQFRHSRHLSDSVVRNRSVAEAGARHPHAAALTGVGESG